MTSYIFQVHVEQGWKYLLYTHTFKYGIAITGRHKNATRVPGSLLDIVTKKVQKFEYIYDFKIRQCIVL